MTKVYLSYQEGTPSFFFLLPEVIKNKKTHMNGLDSYGSNTRGVFSYMILSYSFLLNGISSEPLV